MKLSPPLPKVTHAYRMHTESTTDRTSPMIVKMQNYEAKKKIFDNLKNLKGHKNSDGRAFSIRNQLPDIFNEEDMRKRSIIQANKKLPPAHKMNMQLKKGTLTINGSAYVKKVESLGAKKILSLTNEELDHVKVINTAIGGTKNDSGSTFTGFAIEVNNIEDIRSAYLHFKVKYADAAHVIMAYRLPGVNKAYDKDFLDDGEHGSGRRILKHLIDSDITSRAVFVVRYFGNIYLGAKRFKYITETAQEALTELEQGKTVSSKLDLHLAPQVQQSHSRPDRRNPNRFRSTAPYQPADNIRAAAPPRPGAYSWSSQPVATSNRFNQLMDNSTDPEVSFDIDPPRSQFESLDTSRAEDWHSGDQDDWA